MKSFSLSLNQGSYSSPRTECVNFGSWDESIIKSVNNRKYFNTNAQFIDEINICAKKEYLRSIKESHSLQFEKMIGQDDLKKAIIVWNNIDDFRALDIISLSNWQSESNIIFLVYTGDQIHSEFLNLPNNSLETVFAYSFILSKNYLSEFLTGYGLSELKSFFIIDPDAQKYQESNEIYTLLQN